MYIGGAGNADEAGMTEPTGLGLGDVETRRVPASLSPAVFSCGGGNRIGRCRRLPPASALAFALATHARLGADSAAFLLVVQVGLLRLIVWRVRARCAFPVPCPSLPSILDDAQSPNASCSRCAQSEAKLTLASSHRLSKTWLAGPAGLEEGVTRLLRRMGPHD